MFTPKSFAIFAAKFTLSGRLPLRYCHRFPGVPKPYLSANAFWESGLFLMKSSFSFLHSDSWAGVSMAVSCEYTNDIAIFV